MGFRIVYYRDGLEVGALPCPKGEEEARAAAKNGLKRFDADAAHIVDMDDKTEKIEIVLRDA